MPPAAIATRTATSADLPAIEQMAGEFIDYLNAIEPSGLDPAAIDRIRSLAFGPDPVCGIELAEADGVTVGYMIHFFGVDTETFTPALHIADLFVREDWRGTGAGRILMERAASILHARGGTVLCWTVWNLNQAALDFYRRIGADSWDDAIPMRWSPGQAG